MIGKYKPLNGKQFIGFMEKFCYKCIHRHKGCRILALVLRLNVLDDKYPEQWVYDEKGNPTCTSYHRELND